MLVVAENIAFPPQLPARPGALSPQRLGYTRNSREQTVRLCAEMMYGLLTTARQLLYGKARRLRREAPLIRVPCTKPLKSTLDAAYRRAAVILTTKTGRSYSKRYLAQQWEETCKAAALWIFISTTFVAPRSQC